jgi:hypothetical protein
MKIEQRIGRIDRRGQKSESVAIINLITEGTIDAQIYDRCLTRIGVFEHALGASEAILGDITAGIRRIADDFTLTPTEQNQRFQQLADNQINLTQEQLQLEEKQEDLFGLEMPTNDDDAVRSATSRWLTPDAIAHLVVEYLASIDQGRRLNLTADRIGTLRLSRAMKDLLLIAFQSLPHTSPSDLKWKTWLKSDQQATQVTVNTELATDEPKVHLLAPTHPLVRSAARAMQLTGPVEVTARVSGAGLPPGHYKIAIHGWNRVGIRDDFQLRAITLGAEDTDELMKALAGTSCVDGLETISENDLAALEQRHYAEWEPARALHKERSAAGADAKLRSLSVSSRANMHLLDEQLHRATDDGIRRMRTSQLAAAESDYARRRRNLEAVANESDIESELLVIGLVEVV